MIKILFILTLVAAISVGGANAQHKHKRHHKDKHTVEAVKKGASAEQWADSIMAKMSLEEKVGQLMMIRVPLNMSKKVEIRRTDKRQPRGRSVFLRRQLGRTVTTDQTLPVNHESAPLHRHRCRERTWDATERLLCLPQADAYGCHAARV